MHFCVTLLGWFSLVTAVVAYSYGHEQGIIGGGGGGVTTATTSRHNLTLNFDDLPTNASGIGYDPSTNSTPLQCGDLYFQSFTVVDVAKALKDLPDPVDVLCATSAPNALFGHRRSAGRHHPYPRLSVHPLTDPSLPRDPNVTFDMRSMSVSPTGRVPPDALVMIWLNLLKLPPDESFSGGRGGGGGKSPLPPFPELSRGAEIWPQGRVYQLVGIFGPGRHPNLRIDWDSMRRQIPHMGTKVDTFELYGQLFTREGPSEPYRPRGDWELCLDDVAVVIVRKTGSQNPDDQAEDSDGDDDDDGDSPAGRSFEPPTRMFVFAGEDGSAVYDQARGEQLMKELGL
ncbi:hypothetical protein AYL99_08434 [Fonsecaea erecta]|uniref:Uncharacterized protein n=1 Tax=Fonsecaea erecta TaxID=1367422 RepID=A0A178ZE03_9EURO|nr:hypothetical protein AYL99_08434 [Fonsecaea erecta]OAP57696.1 hypothetical protein AYL99_08434 [Fonsecaea erecta]